MLSPPPARWRNSRARQPLATSNHAPPLRRLLLSLALPFLLLTSLPRPSLAASLAAPRAPLTLHEHVQSYLSNGGHAALRTAFNLSRGVYYDPLRTLSREDIPAPPGAGSARYASDLALLRSMGLHVPGVDRLPSSPGDVSTSARQSRYQCSQDSATLIMGDKSDIAISYSDSTPANVRVPVDSSVRKWADVFESSVRIRICFQWDGRTLEELTLGATTSPVFTTSEDRPGLEPGLYSPALAAALEGEDVIPADQWHVHMVLNQRIPWHLDTTPAPRTRYDLATTVLHELTHGLFFSGTIKANRDARTASYTDDMPGRFDRFMVVRERVAVAQMCKEEKDLFRAITNPSLRFVDSESDVNFGLYSPSAFVSGSSTYHFNNLTLREDCERNNISPNDCSDLMTHQLEDGYTQRVLGMPTLRVYSSMRSRSSGVQGSNECILPDLPEDNAADGLQVEERPSFTLPSWGIATVAVIAGVGAILVLGVVVSSVASRREDR